MGSLRYEKSKTNIKVFKQINVILANRSFFKGHSVFFVYYKKIIVLKFG